MRIERRTASRSVLGLPFGRRRRATAIRCDLCQRSLDGNADTLPKVQPGDWVPADGVARLAARLGAHTDRSAPIGHADGELRSLLAAAQDAARVSNIDVSPGMLAGALAGCLLGLAVGRYLFDNRIIELSLDRSVYVLLSAFAIGVIGAVTGAVVAAWRGRCRAAQSLLTAAQRKYAIDTYRLDALSSEHSRLLQAVVRRLPVSGSPAE